MEALFIHDHYFVKGEEELVYDGSGGVFDEKLWERYLKIFDSLIVTGREAKALPNKLVISSTENVSFSLIDDLNSSFDRYTKKSVIKQKLEPIIEKVDFIIIRLPSTLGYFAQQLCEKINKPYILEVVACPWDAYNNYGNFKGKLIAPIEYFKLKKVVKKASHVIYVTNDFLQNRYPTKGLNESISNVMLEKAILTEKAREFYSDFIKRKTDTNSIFKIGLIGSFHVKFKGHIEAINALGEIVKNNNKTQIRLFLVGTGNFDWVLDYVKKKNLEYFVEIIGTLESGEKGVIPFLDSIHLYIHPSLQEGLPRVVIEAMSRGRLVLASSVAGIPQLIDSSFLHKPGDWKKLSRDILKIYENPKKWISTSEINRNESLKYLEKNLQHKRELFLKKILIDDRI